MLVVKCSHQCSFQSDFAVSRQSHVHLNLKFTGNWWTIKIVRNVSWTKGINECFLVQILVLSYWSEHHITSKMQIECSVLQLDTCCLSLSPFFALFILHYDRLSIAVCACFISFKNTLNLSATMVNDTASTFLVSGFLIFKHNWMFGSFTSFNVLELIT